MGKIIKFKGEARRRKLMVLTDSGSTHSSLNEATATDLQCELMATTPLFVMVANCNQMFSHYKCAGFQWFMQRQKFSMDLRVLELGGCDIVFRVDWMRTVSPLMFDFNRLEVIMEVDGKKLKLVGSLESGECRIITGKKLQKLFTKGKFHISQLFSIHAVEIEETGCTGVRDDEKQKVESESSQEEVTSLGIFNELLIEFKDLFAKPTFLPLTRALDHAIPLKPNLEPVNI